MLIPYTVDVPLERYPIVNWILIAFTMLISLAVFFAGGSDGWESLILVRGEVSVWALCGHVFVHGGVIHLLGNMVFLFCFGNALNAKLGHVPYLLVYLLLGALGGLAWLALGEGSALVGASGAIMGVVGMFLICFPRNDVYVFYWWYVRMGSFSLSSYWLILAYIAFDLWGAFRGSAADNVAYISHLTGAFAGVLIIVVLLLTGLIRSTETEQNLLQLLGIQKPTEQRTRRR